MGELRYLKRKGFVFEATNGRYLPIPALTHLLPGRYQAHLLANGRWLLSATPIDPPTTLYDNYQQLLAKTFGFRPQDLDLNNQGELSFYQKCLATFRRAIVYIIPIFLFSLPGYFFLLFIGLIILLDVGHYIYNLWFLPLETVQGEIITSYYYRHTGRGKSKRYYIAQVNNQNLHITHQQYEVLQSKLTYQIYYVKDHIMSLKLIDTNLS
ncbi:MAG TPA: hypothetical protein VLL52_10135 [Anaerolineae bacterium]|nr:hypothetical protein [Anaerolineae bacterium]